MYKQVMRILDEQEQEESAIYQSADLVRAMIKQDFKNSADVLRLLCQGTIHSVGTCGGNDIILKFTIPGPMFFETVAPVLLEHKKEKVVVFEHGSSQVPFYIFMLLKEVYCRLKISEEIKVYMESDVKRYLLYRMYILTIMMAETFRYGFLYSKLQGGWAKRELFKCLEELEK